MRTSSHRHSVILPLLALSIAGSSLAAIASPSSIAAITLGTTVPEIPGEVFTHASGLRGILLPGARMDLSQEIPSLLEGSILVTADRPVVIHAGAFVLQTIGGGSSITRSGDSITVAALTAPVLVSLHAARVTVPAGTQWRFSGTSLPSLQEGFVRYIDARKVMALPERFTQEQFTTLLAIPQDDSLPPAHSDIAPAPEQGGLLPGAFSRRREEWVEEILGVVRARYEAGDAVGIQELLLQSDLRAVCLSARGKAVLSTLLFGNPAHVALATQFLQVLSSETDLWLLLSLHPAAATITWTLTPPMHTAEEGAVRLFAFPFVDTGNAQGNTLAWQRFETELQAFVAASQNPSAVTGEIIVRLGPIALQREREGYPERARMLAEALQNLRNHVKGDISPQAEDMLRAFTRFSRIDAQALAAVVTVSSAAQKASSSVPEQRFDAALVESQARAMLRGAGAAFSIETRIIPLSAARARVEGIVFAGATRDRTLTFTIDLTRAEAMEILEGVESYPYAMPWEKFVEWVRR